MRRGAGAEKGGKFASQTWEEKAILPHFQLVLFLPPRLPPLYPPPHMRDSFILRPENSLANTGPKKGRGEAVL